jgi:hypothetical protein
MTYEIDILEPSVHKIIQELANLNLITFRQKSKKVKKQADKTATTREEALEGWKSNVEELRGAILEGKPMRSAWALLAELEKEAA